MKKSLLLYTAAVLISATTIAQIPTSGLVAHYPFNGNADDESNNTNDGTVNSAILATDRFGNVNSLYSYDGVNSLINIPLLDLSGGDKITISVWIKPSDVTTNEHYHIMRQDNGIGGLDWLLAFQDYGTHLSFGLGSGGSYSELDISITSNDYINAWHHIVATYDGTTRSVYKDGVLLASDVISGNISFTSSATFAFGSACAKVACGERFKGDIDDVRIYDSIITECEIGSIYNENDMKLKVTVQDTLSIYISQIITSVYDASNAVTTVKVYPNPTDNDLTVEIDNYANLSGVTIKVLNAQSAEVHNEAVTSATQSIDVSSWTAGVYFLHIMNGSTTVDVKKIVVNN